MAQYQGLTAEMYRAVVAIVDDRMKEIRVVRQEFDRLVEAHARTEAALNRLSEAQARTEAALNRLSEAQAQTEARVRELAEAQERYQEASEARFARIEAVLEQVVVQLQKLTDRTGKLEGRLLELTYQQKAGSYFGHLLRRPRAFLPAEIEDQLEGRLTQEEFRDLLAVDLLVSGRPRHLADAPQIWLVVEISATVDRHDVERARQRADLLRRAGLRAIPTVAGEDATMGALEEAKTHKVLMLQDGRSWFWEEALAEALQ